MTLTFTLNITVASLKILTLSYNWFKALYKNVWNYKTEHTRNSKIHFSYLYYIVLFACFV